MSSFLINLRYNVRVQEIKASSSDHHMLLLVALIYTVLGLLWGLAAVFTIDQRLRSLVILGIIVVLSLLLGQFVRQVRDAALIPVNGGGPGGVQPRLRPGI